MANDAARAEPRESADLTDKALSNWRTWFLGLLLVAAVIFAAIHWGDVKKFASLVARAEPLWLLAAFAAQLLTYVSQAFEWLLVLRACDCKTPLVKLLPLTFTKHFADQMVPTAGMSGNVVVVDRLRQLGASRKVAVAAVILAIISYYASYAICALGVLLLLFVMGRDTWLMLGLIGAFLVIAAGIPSLALWLQKKGQRAIPKWLRNVGPIRELFDMIGEAPGKLVRSGELITELSILNGIGFVLDGLTMQFCLYALGVDVPFASAFIAFIIASIVVTLGPIPMGLGSFEAVSIATLRIAGVPFEAALSATLLFRGFTLWLPLLPGMIAARRDLKHRPKTRL
ncbi:MAG TPA: lysylphosphatidylglycerol synthase transmembrane domain-containing protein [Sphingomicrobium sp.]|nr:lysylphosphatidylglycerol synthase transmembrane domain-containing protein [Sphingomicrobium sp.]